MGSMFEGGLGAASMPGKRGPQLIVQVSVLLPCTNRVYLTSGGSMLLAGRRCQWRWSCRCRRTCIHWDASTVRLVVPRSLTMDNNVLHLETPSAAVA